MANLNARVVGTYPSNSDPDKVYTVKEKDGALSCDCRPWIFNQRGNRTCRHTDIAAQELNITQLPPVAKKATKTGNPMPAGWVHPLIAGKGKGSAPKSTVAPVTRSQEHPKQPIKLEVHSPVKAAPASSFPFSGEQITHISPMLASKGDSLQVLRLAADPKWVAERKLDGGRYMLYVLKSGARLFSRHISVKDDQLVEKTENVPHLTHITHPDLAGTVLDGEITIPGGDFGNVLNVMGAHSDKAEARQAAGTLARLTVFDCPRHCGRDITNFPLIERQRIAKEVIALLRNPNVVFVEQVTTDKMDFYKKIVAAGGEGIILKDINSKYFPGKRGGAWVKVKKSQTYDVVISDFYATESDTWAKQGLIGSVIFSVYNEKGLLVEVGRSSGMTLAVRRDMSANPHLYKGQVCEIEGQEVLRDGIRHPRFIRMRPDANAKECTMEKLMKS